MRNMEHHFAVFLITALIHLPFVLLRPTSEQDPAPGTQVLVPGTQALIPGAQPLVPGAQAAVPEVQSPAVGGEVPAAAASVARAPASPARAAARAPADRVQHKDYEIPESAIIDLPFGRFPEPQCVYSVHADGPDGPEVKKTGIGQRVYHKWRCDAKNANSRMFCILVKNCTVSSVSSDRPLTYPIIDEYGCTLEPQILPDVSYNGDLEGGILCNAFALGIEQTTISFNCDIKLLLKDDAGVCRRPRCNPQTKSVRRA